MNIKKIVTTSLLIISILTGINGNLLFQGSNQGTYAKAATKNKVCKDAVKGNKACKKMKNKKVLSPYSKVVSTQPQEKKPVVSVQEPSKTQSNKSFTVEVLKLVNLERAKVGLKALTTTDSLQKAADKRATEIATSFSHTRPDGKGFVTILAEYNITYLAAGENIAEGQKTPEEVMKAWMNSSGHKANILGSQFGKVGVGVYKGSNGRYYWTQVFTD